MRKFLLLLLLPFAWMVKVEAQWTPTIEGYFNPVGDYEWNGIDAYGWAYSSILGYHENPDGSVEVFTNFDTLAGEYIDYAFTIDGENWYPSSEELGTYGVLENVFSLNDPNDRYTYGTYGVKNFQGTTMVPVTWWPYGSMFSMSYIDEDRNQVVLLEQLNDDPEDTWDEPVNNLILWDGVNYQVVGSGLLKVTFMFPVDSGTALLIGSISGTGPNLYKFSLVEQMMVPLSEAEDFGFPDGFNNLQDGLNFLGKATVTGSIPGHGNAIAQLDESGWENNLTELSTGGKMYLNEEKTKLFYCSDDNSTSGEIPEQYISGIGWTEDMETWTPVIDQNGAKSTNGYNALVLFSKGVMWVLGKRNSSFGFMNEEDTMEWYDMYVLKDTYTPYSTGLSESQKPEIEVYPNPATDYFVYDLPESGSIYSLEGHIIKTIGAYEKSVSVTNIPSGMYVIKTENGSSMKIVIQH